MSKLRKHINQIREEKEIKEVSRVIVESRIKEIVGGPDFFERFSQLSEDKKVVIAYKLFCELNELDSYGLIEEQDLWSAFKGLFGGFSGMLTSGIETLAEPIISKALQAIGMDPSWYGSKVVISLLTSNPTELIRALTSCEAFSKLLAESLIEAFVMELQQQKGGNNLFFDFLRNTVGNQMKEYTDPLTKSISVQICKFFSSLIKNIGNLQLGMGG